MYGVQWILLEQLVLKFFIFFVCNSVVRGHPKNLAWTGGPLHITSEFGVDVWTRSGLYVNENIVAIKALTFKDDIYVITPRMKHGVLASVWLIVRGDSGVELQPFPELQDHKIFDCNAIQNAVDFYLDHLGNLWILDTGIVETSECPRCTCPPKVVAISAPLGKITRKTDLSPLTEPSSVLQNIVVEYGLGGKPFVYVSDASRGAILVTEMSSGSQWTVLVCGPAASLQFALVKRGLSHSVILVTPQQPGLLELDTASLRRKNSLAPLRVYGEHWQPVILLGSDAHHLYLRHTGCSDVLSWDTRLGYNASRLDNVHSAGPRFTPTSVAADPLKHVLLVLDSNYGDTAPCNQATYHRITFIDALCF